MGGFGEARESSLLGLGQTVDDIVIEVHPAYVVTGTVKNTKGEPCEQASVSLVDAAQSRRKWASSETGDGTVVAKAVLPGSYEITVYCEEFLAKEDYPPVEIVDKDVTGLEWEVGAGATIVGTVKSADGEAVEGASVWAQTLNAGDPRARRGWGSDTTRSDGKFEMTGLVPGQYKLEVSAPNQPGPEEPPKVETSVSTPATVEIILPSSGGIRGTVKDERGQPVAGAKIETAGKRWSMSSSGSSQSRDDGTFELEGVTPGSYRVTASLGERWGAETLRAPGKTDDDVHGERVEVKADEVATVSLVVESQDGSLTGKVVDQGGNPVTDAFVGATRESEAAGANNRRNRQQSRWSLPRKPVLTDTDGRFTVSELPPGKYTLHAYRRGGGEAFIEGVSLGEDRELTIKTTGLFAGRLGITGDEPPDEFKITVSDRSSGFRRTERFYRTGGEWIMRDMPAGKYIVSASAAEGTKDMPDVILAEGEEKRGVVLMLEARASVIGRLVSLDTGKPIPGYSVTVQPVKGARGMTVFWGDKDKEKITDSEGRFRVNRAAPGRVYVSAWAMNWDDSEYGYVRRIAIVEAGEETDVGTIKVPKKRVAGREVGGDLGFETKAADPDADPSSYALVIALVRPDGPAADTGLEVGDEIVSVDGHDVRGDNIYLFWSLGRVPEGESVTFGLKRGATVKITAGPQP